MPRLWLDYIDRLVELGGACSRSELIRIMINEFLFKDEDFRKYVLEEPVPQEPWVEELKNVIINGVNYPLPH